MTGADVLKKIREAQNAVSEYQRQQRSAYHEDIVKGLDDLIKKRYALEASGEVCPTCGGSGRR